MRVRPIYSESSVIILVIKARIEGGLIRQTRYVRGVRCSPSNITSVIESWMTFVRLEMEPGRTSMVRVSSL